MQRENVTQAAGPRDLDIWVQRDLLVHVEVETTKRRERPRYGNDNHGAHRFGPLPGEVYADEAHFGSFS